jgi:hypothetical protein
MQPEPIASSPRINNTIDPTEPSTAAQHGFLPQQLHPADLQSPLDGEEHIGSGESSTVESPPGVARLHEQLQRLSLSDGHENRIKPSFQRISEYENALSPSPPRKEGEGPGFKIIKKKGNRLDGPQLDSFPNGMPGYMQDACIFTVIWSTI